jgi:TfoX/Sxy family transcriptional regulator of competence genes
MVWVKIPAEHHPIFRDAVPRDPRVTLVHMFGGIAALVNGNMFGGLFARSVVVKLSAADQERAEALDGTEPFDPMGNGRVMKDALLLPESVMDEPAELRGWLARALAYTATLPAKKKGTKKPAPAKATAKAKPKAKPKAKAKAKAKAKRRR